MKTQRKHKIIALVVSLILVAVLVLLFFLDTSSAWDAYKIFSCVVCSIWTLFLPPAVLYFAYKMKNSAPEYSVRLGVCIRPERSAVSGRNHLVERSVNRRSGDKKSEDVKIFALFVFSLAYAAEIAPVAARSGEQSTGLFGLRKTQTRKQTFMSFVRLLPQTPPRRGRAALRAFGKNPNAARTTARRSFSRKNPCRLFSGERDPLKNIPPTFGKTTKENRQYTTACFLWCTR